MIKKEMFIVVAILLICGIMFMGIKTIYFKDSSVISPIKSIIKNNNEQSNEVKYAEATTIKVDETTTMRRDNNNNREENEIVKESVYPYEVAPVIVDDGSIIYDGMTVTELTNKLNKSLKGYMMNTGYFYARYTKNTGLDPYLAVSITLLETGCKWGCSKMTVQCNNIGGLKFSGSCNGTSYSKYDTLEQGITAYLNIIYTNYYSKGLTTPELMASKYAASPTWAQKVNTYIDEVKAK